MKNHSILYISSSEVSLTAVCHSTELWPSFPVPPFEAFGAQKRFPSVILLQMSIVHASSENIKFRFLLILTIYKSQRIGKSIYPMTLFLFEREGMG